MHLLYMAHIWKPLQRTRIFASLNKPRDLYSLNSILIVAELLRNIDQKASAFMVREIRPSFVLSLFKTEIQNAIILKTSVKRILSIKYFLNECKLQMFSMLYIFLFICYKPHVNKLGKLFLTRLF
jgi:hypothetical protein